MTKVVCAPASLIPVTLDENVNYFTLYSNIGRPGVGSISPGWIDHLEHLGLAPSVQVWDFTTLALAVSAADLACSRSKSADGWTRVLELEVHLCNPDPWIDLINEIESTLRFLTGDFWTLNFLPNGVQPPRTTAPKLYDADCVSLLSGGVDSLIGAIDLTTQGRRPLFVSQVAKGDAETQYKYARDLGAIERHFQWNHRIKPAHSAERSTRGRSIVFFAFAALASTAISNNATGPVEVFVPENGFISLNIPLNPGRLGSFSTKTTHPLFMKRLQNIWDNVGINAILRFPYRYVTKGEMLASCTNQTMLQQLVGKSTSCGRFATYNYKHCGRCVPCLVRRAAFLRAGIPDTTPIYVFNNLALQGRDTGANDIGALAAAYLRYRAIGSHKFSLGSLTFADSTTQPQYEAVVRRSMEELGNFLQASSVI